MQKQFANIAALGVLAASASAQFDGYPTDIVWDGFQNDSDNVNWG